MLHASATPRRRYLFPLLSLQERQRGATVVQAFLQQRRVSQTHQLVGNQAAAGGPQVREQIIHTLMWLHILFHHHLSVELIMSDGSLSLHGTAMQVNLT